MIPYVDLGAQHRELEAELLEAVSRVLRHGGFVLGQEVEQFERAVAQRVGVPHAVGVSSGTAALVLALRLHGIGPGDEVITVSHSFVATASAIVLVGATPVFVDIDDDTMLIAIDAAEAAITPATRALLPVHLGGHPCDLDALEALCARRGLVLIEDCAQAFGARWNHRPVGSVGTGCFSMHPLKNLGACGDAGLVSTRSAELADRCRRLRNLGLVERGLCAEVSGNDRLDSMQAALLGVKLGYQDVWLARRQAHAAAYRAALAGRLRMAPQRPEALDVHASFVIRHRRRDALLTALHARGVDAKVHYPTAIHQQGPFARWACSLPVTERVVDEIISLPISAQLSDDARLRVIDALDGALREVGDDGGA